MKVNRNVCNPSDLYHVTLCDKIAKEFIRRDEECHDREHDPVRLPSWIHATNRSTSVSAFTMKISIDYTCMATTVEYDECGNSF